MSDYRILNVIPQNEEHCKAVVEVMAFDKLVLRFKIVARKDGNGHFPCTANIKVAEYGEERWTPSFALDSNYEREELNREILKAYKTHINGPQASIYDKPTRNTPEDFDRLGATKTRQEEELPF